jgi:hypothetical protein
MSESSDRDARLDELQQAVDQWLANQTEAITNIIASQQQLLAGRGSPSQDVSTAATSVVVDQLKEFTS